MWIGTAGLSFTAVPRVSFLYLNYPTVTTCTQDLLDPEHMKDLSSQKGGCVCACVCAGVCGCDEWCDAAALLGISSGRRIFKA